MWPEVEQVSSKHRYELVLSGSKLQQRLEQSNQFDEEIWNLIQLNYLEISECSLVEFIPEHIGKLIHLTALTLTRTRIIQIPNEIENLENLRHINLSNNRLTKLKEDLFFHFKHLETLNLSNNFFVEIPPFSSENKKLFSINFSHNQMEKLADFPVGLENLSHIDLSSNQFKEFPRTICKLTSVKTILFESNQLSEIPAELSQLHRLKGFLFVTSPYSCFSFRNSFQIKSIKRQSIEQINRTRSNQSCFPIFIKTMERTTNCWICSWKNFGTNLGKFHKRRIDWRQNRNSSHWSIGQFERKTKFVRLILLFIFFFLFK